MSTREEGLAALKAGDPETAIRHFQGAVQSAPEDAQSWAGMGIALCQAQRPSEGVDALKRATSLAPNQPSFQYNLGRAYEMLQRPHDALSAYRRTQEIDPKHAQSGAAVQRLSAASDAPPAPAAPTPMAEGNPASEPKPEPAAAPAAPWAASSPAPTPTSAPSASPPSPAPWAAAAPVAAAAAAVVATPASAPSAPAIATAGPAAPPPSPAGAGLGEFSLGAPPPSSPAPAAAPPAWGGSTPPPPPPGPWAAAPPPPPPSAWQAPQVPGFGPQAQPAYSPPPTALPPAAYFPPPKERSSGWGGGFGGPWLAIRIGIAVIAGVFGFFRAAGGGGFRGFGGADLNTFKPGSTVSVPGQGVTATLPAGVPTATLKYESGTPLYQSQGGAGEWVVGAIPLSADVLSQGPDAIFAKFRDGVSGSKKGAISNSSSLQVKGYPASDMSFEAGAGLFGNEKGRMRLIIADDRLVMLAYGSHSAGDLNKPAVNGFFDSVTIDKHQAPVAVSSPGGSGPGLAPQSHISIAPVHIPEPPQVSIPEHHYEPPTMPGPSIPSGPSFPPGPSGPSGPSFGPGGPGGMSGPGGMGPGGMSPGGPGMGGGPYPGGGRF